jgi:hypothetical protein
MSTAMLGKSEEIFVDGEHGVSEILCILRNGRTGYMSALGRRRCTGTSRGVPEGALQTVGDIEGEIHYTAAGA